VVGEGGCIIGRHSRRHAVLIEFPRRSEATFRAAAKTRQVEDKLPGQVDTYPLKTVSIHNMQNGGFGMLGFKFCLCSGGKVLPTSKKNEHPGVVGLDLGQRLDPYLVLADIFVLVLVDLT